MKKQIALITLSLVAVTIAGCGQKTIVSGNGVKVTEDKKGQYTITDSGSGGTITVGTDKIPANFPADVPLYKNGKVTATTVLPGAANAAIVTDDSLADIKNWYLEKFKAGGWASTGDMSTGDGFLISASKANGESLIVTAGPNTDSSHPGKFTIGVVQSSQQK